MMEKLSFIYVTTRNKNEAKRIGEKLIKEKLAACINVFDNMSSSYIWEGKMERANEAVLIIKTRKALLEKVEKNIKKLHSYSCPCIIAIPIIRVNKEFAEWIVRQTSRKGRG